MEASASLNNPSGGKSTAIQALAVLVLLAACLYPLWANTCPAMQDYPRHLVRAQIAAEISNPDFDYAKNFEQDFSVRPYFAFYGAVILFHRHLGMGYETAGKAAVSLYFLAIAALAFAMLRRGFGWAVLLFFPLSFAPQYYLGTTNYLYSLPALVAAAWDLEGAHLRRPAAAALRQAALILLVLFLHPMALMAYTSIALANAVFSFRRRREAAARLLAGLFCGLLFLGWYTYASYPGAHGQGPSAARFMIFVITGIYALFPFTGMARISCADRLVLLLWAGAAAVLAAAAIRSRKSWWEKDRFYLVCWVVLILEGFILPYRVGIYSMLSLRLFAAAGFFGTLALSRLGPGKKGGIALFCLAFLILAGNAVRQGEVSREIAEVLPVVEEIPKNSRVLPLVFEAGSPRLPLLIFQPHLHAHQYYHLRRGGGYTPHWGGSELVPVRPLPDRMLPAPNEYNPENFSWREHGRFYEYLLVRSPTKEFLAAVAPHFLFMAQNGPWVILRNREPAAAWPEK